MTEVVQILYLDTLDWLLHIFTGTKLVVHAIPVIHRGNSCIRNHANYTDAGCYIRTVHVDDNNMSVPHASKGQYYLQQNSSV